MYLFMKGRESCPEKGQVTLDNVTSLPLVYRIVLKPVICQARPFQQSSPLRAEFKLPDLGLPGAPPRPPGQGGLALSPSLRPAWASWC